ncbi:hypothetical protein PENSPDRAFT_586452 [Peniophora sp. CONT]|nr:hypothetical protein PENSPDRAFT_586452 [Peniophora sp. CONT]
MRSVFALLSLAASALAFEVIEPSASQNWRLAADNNTVSWSSVKTDRSNFTIVLVNQDQTPAYSQIISALVDTSLNSIAISLPNTNYRVNLVQDSENLNTILAQSNDFEVLAASSSTSTSASQT